MKCPKCNIETEGTNFCPRCGTRLYYRGKAVDASSRYMEIFLYYGIFLAYLVISIIWVSVTGNYSDLWITVIFDCIVVAVAIPNIALIKRSLSHFYMKHKVMLISIAIAIVYAFMVSWLNMKMSESLDLTVQTLIDYDQQLMHPLLYTILLSALSPALFEELAFRAVLFNITQKYTNIKNTIIITGILFALIHFSIISLIWLIPGGIALGYLRARYRTIWYGVILHFLYNSSVIFIEYFGIA